MDGALLGQTEIDNERGVIVSEMQARDSITLRMRRKVYEWALPDHMFSKRFLVGTEETIRNMTRRSENRGAEAG